MKLVNVGIPYFEIFNQANGKKNVGEKSNHFTTLHVSSSQMRQILRFVLLVTLLHFAKPYYGTPPNEMDISDDFVQIESDMISKLEVYFLKERERLSQIKK